MDPISAAGIALSITSLTLQVFAGCLKGYQVFAEAADLPETYQHLRTRLRIEQSRHLNWGEQVGLLEESLEKPSQVLCLHRSLVLDILVEVSEAFAATLNISSQYEEFVPDIQPRKEVSTKQLRFLERARSRWRTPDRVVRRLQWAMIKQEKFETLVARLVGYNDAMESILDRSSLKDLCIMQEKSNLLLLQLTEKVSQLQILSQALEIKPILSIDVTKSTFQPPSISPPGGIVSINALATFKIQNIRASEDANSKNLHVHLDKIRFIEEDPEEQRSLAKLNGARVSVEWRTPLDSEIPAKDSEIIEERLGQLAFLLNKADKPLEFRCPRCIGYCRREKEDEIQYGLIFEIPPSNVAEPRIATLRDCFQNICPPSLTTRITIANAMIESLLYLHAVNWLHKGFRSENIIFYVSSNESMCSESELASPLISGFDFSRPDTLDETTVKSASIARHDYYKHPQLLQHSDFRSQKSHDIYALGIVLIELSLWQRIEDTMAIILGKPLTTSQIPKIRQRLLSDPYKQFANVIAAVTVQSGQVYANVVRNCIEGGHSLGLVPNADESDPVVSAALQRAYYDDVYLKLKSVHV